MPSDRHDSIWDPAGDEAPVPVPAMRGPLASFFLSFFGLIALAMPLVLWVSWSQTMLMVAFAIGLVSIAGCWLIVHFGPD